MNGSITSENSSLASRVNRKKYDSCQMCLSYMYISPFKKWKYIFIERSIQSVGQLNALYTSPVADLLILTPTRLPWEVFYPCSNYAPRTPFTHISTVVYSEVLIYTAEWTEASRRERKYPSFETVARGIRTRAISIASPSFYRWATSVFTMYSVYLWNKHNPILS